MQRKKCKARKKLKNDALDAKIGVDTAANEPRKGSETCNSDVEELEHGTAERDSLVSRLVLEGDN